MARKSTFTLTHAYPDRNDEVMVKYEGRVNGAAFTASTNSDFELVKLGLPTCPLPPGDE